MGFMWSAEVCVRYGSVIQIPISLGRFAKRLVYYGSAARAKRACADVALARRCPPTKRQMRLASFSEAKPGDAVAVPGGGEAGGDGGEEEGEEDDPFTWSECPSELSDDEGELLNEMGDVVRRSHHPDCVFELEYNYPELIEHAFTGTAAKLLGDGDHGLKLELLRGGSPAPSADAVEVALFLSYEP
eukprot:4598432-Prymnesium_polylepis.2